MPCCGSSAGRSHRRRNSNSNSKSVDASDGKKEGLLDKHPKLKRTVGKGKALLYIIFNSLLPGIDVISDFLTFNELMYSGNPKWAWVTLFCIFLPFLFKCCMFFKDLVRGRASLQNLAGLILHFPLMSPLIFATLGLRLLMIDETKAENAVASNISLYFSPIGVLLLLLLLLLLNCFRY